MDHTTVNVILKKIDEVRTRKAELLTKTMASDMADYARKFGHLQALDEIWEVIHELSIEVRKNN